jgi:predicted metal-binding protein
LARPTLFVCVTCQAGQILAPGETPQGALLHAALRDRLARAPDAADPDGVTLREISCLANCERGCSAAISMPGKWSNLLGHLSPALADDLLAYVRAYAASATGTVMPSRRPASLGALILGRVPHPETAP